jgi:hypothetical protein
MVSPAPTLERGAGDCGASCTRWRRRGPASGSLGGHRGEEAARGVAGAEEAGVGASIVGTEARASRGRAQRREGGGGEGRGTGIAAAEARARAGVAAVEAEPCAERMCGRLHY